MRNKIIYLIGLTVAIFTLSVVNNHSHAKAIMTTQDCCSSKTMEVDQLLKDTESLVGKTVNIEGVCTHICSHGGTKLFLMGSDDKNVIRVQAGKLGSFSTDCKNSMLTISGEVKEDRIDEAYLSKWEAEAKAAEAKEEKEHSSHSCSNCSKEKSVKGEKSNSTADRIAAFREKISERESKEGKAYLSFYYVEASKYEIQ